jgi:hypothetical protein
MTIIATTIIPPKMYRFFFDLPVLRTDGAEGAFAGTAGAFFPSGFNLYPQLGHTLASRDTA